MPYFTAVNEEHVAHLEDKGGLSKASLRKQKYAMKNLSKFLEMRSISSVETLCSDKDKLEHELCLYLESICTVNVKDIVIVKSLS